MDIYSLLGDRSVQMQPTEVSNIGKTDNCNDDTADNFIPYSCFML